MAATESVAYETEAYEDVTDISDDIHIERAREDCPSLDFRFDKKPVYSFFKRLADICLSLMALIVLSPVLIVVCIIVLIRDFGNPFFSQDRVGR